MPGQLSQEIQQRAPFASLEVEAYLNLVRTADLLQRQVAEALRAHDLSPTSYNVLRILRGAGAEGLPCGAIAGRLVAHDPDVTRLVDRLERRGLVERARRPEDRRLVVVRITDAGHALLAPLDAPLVVLAGRQLGPLGPDRLAQLIALCETLRAGLNPPIPTNPEKPCSVP